MKAYAIGQLHNVNMGDAILMYLKSIDATLAPFGGRFIIHGGAPEVLEGAFASALIVIEFADMATARAWYRSAAYQAILPLRADNSEGPIFLIEGVDAEHKATDVLGA